jgi:hypothetical protein
MAALDLAIEVLKDPKSSAKAKELAEAVIREASAHKPLYPVLPQSPMIPPTGPPFPQPYQRRIHPWDKTPCIPPFTVTC